MSTSFLNLGAAAPPTAPSPTKNVPPQGTKKQEETPLSNPYDIHDMEAAKRAKDRIQDRFRKANNRRYIFELTEWNRQRFSPDFTRSFTASFFSLNERFRCALPEGSQIKKPSSVPGCGWPVAAKSLCWLQYRQLRKRVPAERGKVSDFTGECPGNSCWNLRT